MIDGFKTVSLAWVNKIAMIGYTWLFVYESARRYKGRMNAAPDVFTFFKLISHVLSKSIFEVNRSYGKMELKVPFIP